MAEKKAKEKQIRAIRSGDFRTTYVNFSHFSMSNFDLIIDSGIRNRDEIELTTRIIMSSEHAKVFSDKLQEVIKDANKKINAKK